MKPYGSSGGIPDIDATAAETMLDLREVCMSFPDMNEGQIARAILDRYVPYIDSVVVDPERTEQRADRTPIQNATDLSYLRALASHCGYVFEIEEPVGGRPLAYWGPSRTGAAQALAQ